jgi:hypothetical protein
MFDKSSAPWPAWFENRTRDVLERRIDSVRHTAAMNSNLSTTPAMYDATK